MDDREPGFGDLAPEGVEQVDPGAHYERPVDRFRRGAVGSVLAAGMFGLADVLEGREKREQPAIVTEAPTKPDDEPIRLLLDPDHPDRSVVIVRRRPDATGG
ncbi:MAG: hypothetical protein JOZ99_06585 [Actinobacteria bacterium]|nr:hypothetical protein [Actinomycetota bacterium]